MNRKRSAVLAGVALAGLAGAGAGAVVYQGRTGNPQQASTDAPTSTTAVVTSDVLRRQNVSGTLGRSGSFTVIAPGQGTLTWLPAVGAVVGRGKPAYEVDGKPVILLFGDRPPWRALQSGMTDGADVRQLEDNLRALGYGAGLTVDQHFSSATYWAIRRWQKDSGLAVTGTVPLGQVVFVAGAVRVSSAEMRAGSAVGPGQVVERATSEQRAITTNLTTGVLQWAHVGDPVVVTLPDDSKKTGTITSIGAVAQASTSSGGPGQNGGSNAQPTAPVVITLTGEVSGVLEDAQVQVGVTVTAHRGVLAVPVPALRALPHAAYEVLVVDGAQTRHVPVQVGIFDQVTGLVEVSGDGLAAGQRVAVPNEQS
ncbi:peptidoglycan-binding domain-containing protein [Dactylosporangium darangshiense]|uniref:Peptidoglycan-binding protein n=1 Tax=Dactylosporangium darangshiense TaxID=579108 RepID=A0ABP8DDT3_9ACTN